MMVGRESMWETGRGIPPVTGLASYGNLVNTLLMATAFKSGFEEFVHNLLRHLVVDETTWHDQDVGIVVLTDEVGNLRNPSQSGTNTLMLVEGHGNTFA